MPSRTRHAVAVEATGAEQPGLVTQHRQIRDCLPAPSASITATSTSTRSGSWHERRCRSGLKHVAERLGQPGRLGQITPAAHPGVRGVPLAIGGEVILGRTVVACTCEVPLCADDHSLDNPDPTAQSRHLRLRPCVQRTCRATMIRSLLQQPG